MRKLLLAVLVIFLAAGTVSAVSIDLGNFPIGKWLDKNYDAIWDFTSSNIKILAPDGTEYFDFSKNTVKDFKVSASSSGAVITFSCEEAGRSYKITKPLTNMDLILEIDRPDKEHYKVEMKKQ